MPRRQPAVKTESIRVLFCTLDYPPSITGGAERQASLQAEELVRRGHSVDVVCPRSSGHASQVINGVRVHRLPRVDRRPFRTISYLAVLAAFLLLRLGRYDLVHVHLANAQADVAVVAARLLGRASYLKVAAGGPLGELARFRRVARITRYYGIRHASLVQAISDEIRRDLINAGAAPSRIREIPNGVLLGNRPTANSRLAMRQRFGISATAIVVIFAGRLERDKGVTDLLEAWKAGPPAGAVLAIIGSPGIKDPVAMDLLPANVEYLGWTPDAQAHIAAADIFVLPSHAEGMSNALLEAMAAGVACIATRVGAAETMIRDGEHGLLVDAGDAKALGNALRRLVDSADLRSALGAAGRERVGDRYGIKGVVDRIEAAYRSVLPAI